MYQVSDLLNVQEITFQTFRDRHNPID